VFHFKRETDCWISCFEEDQRVHTIQNIFDGYSVGVKSYPGFEDIILNCEEHLSLKRSETNQTLKKLRANQRAIIFFCNNHQDELHIASYFLSNKSSIYNNKIEYGSWSSLILLLLFQKQSKY
jgi:hypothetical protein